jgi:hypothetical protein
MNMIILIAIFLLGFICGTEMVGIALYYAQEHPTSTFTRALLQGLKNNGIDISKIGQ